MAREKWGSRIGLILAAAGNAVGIGNLLRFPAQAGQNGGGAFMVPYFLSLLLLGIPMMWVAWTVGRMGGRHGHGSTPGMFTYLWKHPAAKYLGVIGVSLPLIFCLYYTYIEAWCLGYAWYSFTGDYVETPGRAVDLKIYLNEFQGAAPTNNYFSGVGPAVVFLAITILLNVTVLYRGVTKGIEVLAKIAMPLLLLFCVIMAVRVLTLEDDQGSVADGLNFIWTPDFSDFWKPGIWLAAAGQIFFTLSIGFGSMESYASYIGPDDDIVLTGLTTAGTNEFVEVIFGSAIAIPAAAVFFGGAPEQLNAIASTGSFDIGMVTMPEVLRNMPGASVTIFGGMWFLLLFFAAFTSSVAVAQPVVAFLQDEAKLSRGVAAILVGMLWLFGGIFVAYFLKYGVLDEFDFWAGQLGLVVLSLVEIVLFSWVFGVKKGWDELHRGADIRAPRVFYFILAYVTPVLLAAILGGWVYTDVIQKEKLKPVPSLSQSYEPADGKPLDGHLVFSTPREAGGADTKKEIETIFKEQVTHAKWDLSLWADVECGADGKAVVRAVHGPPRLTNRLGAPEVQRYLDAQNATFQKAKVPSPARLTVTLEGRYRAPYIWLARAVMMLFTLGFGFMVFAIWRARRSTASAQPAS